MICSIINVFLPPQKDLKRQILAFGHQKKIYFKAINSPMLCLSLIKLMKFILRLKYVVPLKESNDEYESN